MSTGTLDCKILRDHMAEMEYISSATLHVDLAFNAPLMTML